jgi:alpha-L-rhamnosidase
VIKKYIADCLLICFSVSLYGQLHIVSALCENKTNPVGVGIKKIRFSWELSSVENAQYQTAYQMVISSSENNMHDGKYDIWNSSVVRSSQNILVGYGGKKLLSGHTYYWRVRVWDKNNKISPWSSTATFTTGIFESRDWANAQWIGYEELTDSMRVAPGVHAPLVGELGDKCMVRSIVPLFRKEFDMAKKVKSALLFITGLGQYELRINGEKADDAFLAPGWTYFDKRVLYNCYDISEKLVRGHNAIGVIVGNGFYYINRERYFKIVSAFGMPKMICCLKIIYTDGSVENIVSDASWKTAASPITFSSIYGGEDYDARLERPGWDTPSFIDTGWKQIQLVKAPLGKLLPEQDYPVKLLDSFPVRKIQHPVDSVYIYDFGQNTSGIVRLKVKGKRGQVVTLIPAELLDKKQLADQSATGEPAYFSYTLKGDGEEIWQPKFTYYGFRYVQVEGAVPDTGRDASGLPVIIQLTLLHNRNSNPSDGSFACSDELFNRIYQLINWAIKSNMQSVITDCPHREKLSWLEQDYLMGPSIHYNYNIYSLYRKLIFDLVDAQHDQGFVPDIAPELVVFADGFLDSPEWGSSCVILPWLLYTWYADIDILAEAYPMMKKYITYLDSKCSDHILSYGLGDWFDYGPKSPGEAQLTPKAVTATSIYYYDVVLLSKMARILNRVGEAAGFEKQAAKIKKAFRCHFFNSNSKVYSTGSQTAMSMPLCVGLTDSVYNKDVLKNLIDSIYQNGKALTAGDIGFHFLIQALNAGGASQLIYDMNHRDDVPGYGFQLKKGATALTESWAALENVSNNHLMLGHIMEWFYSGLAGISQEKNSVAYKNIIIHPQPVGDIAYAKADFHSPYGWIDIYWEKKNKDFVLRITIPVNSAATVYLSAGPAARVYLNKKICNGYKINNGVAAIKVKSGNYTIQVNNSR